MLKLFCCGKARLETLCMLYTVIHFTLAHAVHLVVQICELFLSFHRDLCRIS